jgi:hypothetical protein
MTLAPQKSVFRPGQFLLKIHELFDLHQKPAVATLLRIADRRFEIAEVQVRSIG